MTRKNADYWVGYNAEAARRAAKDARAAVDAMPDLHELASEVAKALGRDAGRKQNIVQRSPHIFASMDAEELSQASSRELAARELKELGIEFGDGDPVQLLDAHHAGRQYARNGNQLIGASANDAGENPTFLDKYINGT
jgi:hypothetical protein